MDEQEILNLGVGTKEPEKLQPKDVQVEGIRVENVPKYGEKIVLVCKHPDREDVLQISSIKFAKGDKITTSGLWFNTDEDGQIQKGSAVATLLGYYKVPKLGELTGQTLSTTYDSEGYLCIKAI